jgi:hypothetical protein
MIQDLLIPTYEEECDDIPYDLIYTSSTKIPNREGVNSVNETDKKENFLCTNSFYDNSKYSCLFLFLIFSSTVGILYLIIFINTIH